MTKKVNNDPDYYSKMSLPHESEEAANGFGLGDRLRNEACAKPVLQAGGFNQHKSLIEVQTKKVLKNERGQKT